MIIKEFTDEFEKLFPLYLAEKWDNVGLQVGDDNNDITGILLSLDLTTDVVLEAIQKGCNLIVVHHPIIFSPLKQITAKTY